MTKAPGFSEFLSKILWLKLAPIVHLFGALIAAFPNLNPRDAQRNKQSESFSGADCRKKTAGLIFKGPERLFLLRLLKSG